MRPPAPRLLHDHHRQDHGPERVRPRSEHQTASTRTAQGPAGTRTTVFGLGLTGATGVSFDGTAGTDVVVATDGRSVAVTAPAHAPGQVTVVVTTPAGSSETTGDAHLRPYFTYPA